MLSHSKMKRIIIKRYDVSHTKTLGKTFCVKHINVRAIIIKENATTKEHTFYPERWLRERYIKITINYTRRKRGRGFKGWESSCAKGIVFLGDV